MFIATNLGLQMRYFKLHTLEQAQFKVVVLSALHAL